jgi:perosamine synthetase
MHISLDSPLLNGNEKEYLNQCIDTNWISWQGEFVDRLEAEIANYCGTKFGLSIVNGTYAIVIALRALGVKQGDEVIVPTLTMSATTFAVSSIGAKVVFADCAPNSLNAEAQQIKEKVTPNTKAIIAVHLYGSPCNVQAIKEAVGDIPVIEDAAESFGAEINGKRAGSLGDLACHSFHNKIIASGEGGAITFNNPAYKDKIIQLRTPAENNASGTELCLNNRMSNVAAAIALAQLEQVDTLIEKRRKIASIYNEYFKNVILEEHKNVYWRYQIFVNNRQELIACLKEKGIETRAVFTPMHKHPYYNDSNIFPNAELISSTGLDIPTSPALTEQEVRYVATTIRDLQ